MKRRTEHLVEKRDGRREFLRATKLARSIHLALHDSGVDEDWRALEVATVVLAGLRSRHKSLVGGGGDDTVLTTAEIAEAVQQLLVVTGQPAAAARYASLQAERARRRGSLSLLSRSPGGEAPTVASPGVGVAADRLGGRWPGEG